MSSKRSNQQTSLSRSREPTPNKRPRRKRNPPDFLFPSVYQHHAFCPIPPAAARKAKQKAESSSSEGEEDTDSGPDYKEDDDDSNKPKKLKSAVAKSTVSNSRLTGNSPAASSSSEEDQDDDNMEESAVAKSAVAKSSTVSNSRLAGNRQATSSSSEEDEDDDDTEESAVTKSPLANPRLAGNSEGNSPTALERAFAIARGSVNFWPDTSDDTKDELAPFLQYLKDHDHATADHSAWNPPIPFTLSKPGLRDYYHELADLAFTEMLVTRKDQIKAVTAKSYLKNLVALMIYKLDVAEHPTMMPSSRTKLIDVKADCFGKYLEVVVIANKWEQMYWTDQHDFSDEIMKHKIGDRHTAIVKDVNFVVPGFRNIMKAVDPEQWELKLKT